MSNFRLNHTLLFTFIIAFLAMQWTTAHIHLADHHDHDGSHHHNIEVHAHHSIDQHVSAIDLSHQSNNLSVVELDYEFNAQKVEKLEKPSTSVIPSTFPLLSFAISNITKLPADTNTKLSYLYRLTAKPRAPPAYT